MQPPNRGDIANLLRPLVARIASGRVVTSDSKLCADLAFDSLDTIELAMAIEQEFCVEVPDSDWEDGPDRTVGEVVELIATKLATRNLHVTPGGAIELIHSGRKA